MEITNPEAEGREPTFILRRFWRRKWWFVVPVVLAVVGTVVHESRANEVYSASAEVNTVSLIQTALGSTSIDQAAEPAEIDTQVLIAESPLIGAGAARILGSVAGELTGYSVSQIGQTSVLRFIVDGNSPEAARDGANAYADAYISAENKQALAAASASIAQLDGVISKEQQALARLNTEVNADEVELARISPAATSGALPSDLPASERAKLATLTSNLESLTSQRDALTQEIETQEAQLNQLDVSQTLGTSSTGQLLAAASLPSSPVSPRPETDVAVALAAGVVIGLILVFARDGLDPTLRDVEQIRREADKIPVLAEVAVQRKWRRARAGVAVVSEPRSVAAESYRSLRAAIELSRPQNERVLLVTSPLEQEGKSTVAANLAASFTETYEDVVLVDADLRRPRLHNLFDLANNKGLTSVIRGDATLTEALQQVNIGNLSLNVLTTGPLPRNASEVIAGPRLVMLVDHLSKIFGRVILDAPPLLAVSDALDASRLADAVLVVARLNETSARTLRSTLTKLEQTGARVTGLAIATDSVPALAGSYYQPSIAGRAGVQSAAEEKSGSANGARDGMRRADSEWRLAVFGTTNSARGTNAATGHDGTAQLPTEHRHSAR